MPVVQEKEVEQVDCLELKPTLFYGVNHAINHIICGRKCEKVDTMCPTLDISALNVCISTPLGFYQD